MAGEGAFHSSSTFNDRDSRDDSLWHSSQFPTHRHDRDDDDRHTFHHYPYGDFANRQFGDRFPRNRSARGNNSQDDSRSCVFFIIVFCLFGPVTMIFGIYGPTELVLGPNSSMLIQTNPIFVDTLKVESLNGTDPRPMIYEFYEVPPLDTIIYWTENYNLSVAPNYHKERAYYLNAGSRVNISYQLRSHKSSILLIIAKGREQLNDWLNDPTRSSTTLSWNLIHDDGMITQEIYDSSSYYIAVGNLHEKVEVDLHLRIGARVYNTGEAYREFALDWGSFSKDISISGGNSIVLVSPGHNQSKSIDEWYVKLSYGPRWGTYIIGVGGITLLIYLSFSGLNSFRRHRKDRSQGENPVTVSEKGPLLSQEDDHVSSPGSSCNPVSHDDELDYNGKASAEEKPHMDDEGSNNMRRLCAICFDAPRDSFFLPCGHSLACFACGTRITEVSGTCPVCRENISKIKKIFTV